jgi:hypothetical protein
MVRMSLERRLSRTREAAASEGEDIKLTKFENGGRNDELEEEAAVRRAAACRSSPSQGRPIPQGEAT